MKKTLYILLASSLLLSVQSCDEPIDFRDGVESEKIVVESVISPSSTMANYTKVSTSVVVNAQVQDLQSAEYADIMIRDINSEEQFEFLYDELNSCYTSNGDGIEAGRTYEFSAGIVDSDVLDVFATTKVPFETNINDIEQLQIDTLYNPDDNTRYGLRFEYSVIIDAPVSYPAYYRLIPLLKDFGLDAAGKLFLKSDDIFYFDNFDFALGGNASHDLEHREGLLINQSKLDGNKLVLSFETINTMVLGVDRVPKVFFNLQTVEEDYYHYFLTSSRQIKSALSGSNQAITNYSNITNGHGVFTSFSETQDSISIN